MLKFCTFNVQRNHSGEAQKSVEKLATEPQMALCLQEVSRGMGRRLCQIFPHAVLRGENMVIAPQDCRVENVEELRFGRHARSFLHAEIRSGNNTVFLLTGKLSHGLSVIDRYQSLRDMFRLYADHPTILALDTNHILPYETRIIMTLLKKYLFSHTHHPEGTHDIRRSEHSWGSKVPERFARRQLDRIFVSSHCSLQGSHVRAGIISSDHEPVIAQLRFR